MREEIEKEAQITGKLIEWPNRVNENVKMTVEGNKIRFLSTNTLILRRDAQILCVWDKEERQRFRSQIQRQQAPEDIAAAYIPHKLSTSLEYMTDKLEDELKIPYVEFGCSNLIEVDNLIELSPQRDIIKKVLVLTKRIVINMDCRNVSTTTKFFNKAKPTNCNERSHLGDWAIRRIAIMITNPTMLNLFQTSAYKYSTEDICSRKGKNRRKRNVFNRIAAIFGTDSTETMTRINQNTYAVQQLSKSLNALQARLQTGENYRQNLLNQLKATSQRARESQTSDIQIHAAFHQLENFVTVLNQQLSLESAADRYTTAITHASLVLQAVADDMVEEIRHVMNRELPPNKHVRMHVERIDLRLGNRIEVTFTGDLLIPYQETHIECFPEDNTCLDLPVHYLDKHKQHYILKDEIIKKTTHIMCFREPTLGNCRYFAKACETDMKMGYMTENTLTIFSMKGTTLRNTKNTQKQIQISAKTKESHILNECYTSEHREYCPQLTITAKLDVNEKINMKKEDIKMAYKHTAHTRFDLPLSITDYRWQSEEQHHVIHNFELAPIKNKSHVMATVSHIILWAGAGMLIFLILLGCCSGKNPLRLIGKCFSPVVKPLCSYAGTLTRATMGCLCKNLPFNKQPNKLDNKKDIEMDKFKPKYEKQSAKTDEEQDIDETTPLEKIIFEESLLHGLKLLDDNTTIYEIKEKIRDGKGHNVLNHRYKDIEKLNKVIYKKKRHQAR